MTRQILSFIVLAGSFAFGAEDSAIIAEVAAADDARVSAMIAADREQLEVILSDQLHYAHSVLLIENKEAHIALLTGGRLSYRKVDYKTRDFSIVAPGVVLMKGRALVEIGRQEENTEIMLFLVDINYLAVWRLENERWRFFAWQSGRNEEITRLD